jgi:hypothetical protein
MEYVRQDSGPGRPLTGGTKHLAPRLHFRGGGGGTKLKNMEIYQKFKFNSFIVTTLGRSAKTVLSGLQVSL